MSKAGILYYKKDLLQRIVLLAWNWSMFLFAGVKLLRTGYQNRVQTSGPGAARTSPDPGTTSSPAARLSSRAKCEGKHLNISVISSLTLTSSGNPVSSIPQIETYTITSPCPSLVPDVNITLVYLDCLAKFKYYYLLCTFTLSHTIKSWWSWHHVSHLRASDISISSPSSATSGSGLTPSSEPTSGNSTLPTSPENGVAQGQGQGLSNMFKTFFKWVAVCHCVLYFE